MATSRSGQTTNFSNQTISKASQSSDSYSVEDKKSDSARGKESNWTPEWRKWHGYYRRIPELRSAIDKLASWTFGRGIQTDEKDKKKLEKIKGFGKDSPRGVLKNQWRTSLICGDSFAEIITDNQNRLTNLKPLNPDTIKVIFDKYGIINRYEQFMEEDGEKKTINTWEPEEIYHLSHKRLADEIHGIPFPEALVDLIKGRNEGLEDLRTLYHRNIKPINWIEVETDDTSKLNSIESTINKAYKNTENIIIPKGVIDEVKSQKTGQYSTLDSLPYIKFLVRQFVTACGMPEVVMGWGAETTEASSKIIYLAYQQTIEDMQLYNQEQIDIQLGIEINLEFPASLEQDLKKDERKDGDIKAAKKNETEANIKGKT